MTYFGGDQEHRDLAHAHQIERRAQAEDRRRNPDRERHEHEAGRLALRGRFTWGRLITNLIGAGLAVGLLLFLIAQRS